MCSFAVSRSCPRREQLLRAASAGRVPASVVAWKCAVDSFYVTKEQGAGRFKLVGALALFSCWIPPLLRLVLGLPMFGTSGVEKATLALALFAGCLGFMMIMIYVVLPSFDFASRHEATRFMVGASGPCCVKPDQKGVPCLQLLQTTRARLESVGAAQRFSPATRASTHRSNLTRASTHRSYLLWPLPRPGWPHARRRAHQPRARASRAAG